MKKKRKNIEGKEQKLMMIVIKRLLIGWLQKALRKIKENRMKKKEVESQKDDNINIDMESLRLNNPFAKK